MKKFVLITMIYYIIVTVGCEHPFGIPCEYIGFNSTNTRIVEYTYDVQKDKFFYDDQEIIFENELIIIPEDATPHIDIFINGESCFPSKFVKQKEIFEEWKNIRKNISKYIDKNKIEVIIKCPKYCELASCTIKIKKAENND